MNFIELLRISIGTLHDIPLDKDTDWDLMFEMAEKQSLTGVISKGIERLPKEMQPKKQLMFQCYGNCELIMGLNKLLNTASVYIHRLFQEAGIGNCILKGQGNALMYEDPLLRSPGDIDLWIDPHKVVIKDGKLSVGEKQLQVWKPEYHHMEAEEVMDVPLEIHYRPSFMHNLIHNKRLQRWFLEMSKEQFVHEVKLGEEGCVTIPTAHFNMVYQLCHIKHHFLKEGIGLRQLLDYFFVLKNAYGEVCVKEVEKTLKQVGLYEMARAVMYIEHELLGLDEKYLVVSQNEKIGKFLMQEIMISGNFGQFDPRASKSDNRLIKNMTRLYRDIRLFRYFPSECVWEPVFRIYHFFWRLNHRI